MKHPLSGSAPCETLTEPVERYINLLLNIHVAQGEQDFESRRLKLIDEYLAAETVPNLRQIVASWKSLDGDESEWHWKKRGDRKVDYGALATFTPVLHTAYSRDLTGRINGKVETIDGVTTTYDYSYDLRARLTAVMVDGQVTHLYEYDANGNRTVHGTYSDPAPYPPSRRHRPSTSSHFQHALADPSGLAAAGERVYRLHAARTATSSQPRSSA